MIIGLVAMYMPNKNEINNIDKYIKNLDYCFLLDDSAKDNSEVVDGLIKKYPDKVEYHLNVENMGLCKSVNEGFKLAIGKGADWILVMNPDGTFENNAIEIFKSYIGTNNTDEVAILCPQYNFDRHPRTAKKGISMIEYTDMAGSLYNAKILKKLGYYDVNTYFYGLDSEYCLRIKKTGYKIVRCNEAVLNHHPAHTEYIKLGNLVFKYGKDKPERYYYQFRSGFYIHEKYHDIKQDVFMFYKFLKVLLLFDNKREYLKCIQEAKRDAKAKYYGKRKQKG